ncbi:HEAT repeat containing protein [Babesia caballi]|uniref:HEAT repeat containing protein n=1 Tax=Babesia caballi TaxID=5871 RepID=A0AAV4LVM0_BABCB|nr:HEAT repeat containing protein [Babesia caballi]
MEDGRAAMDHEFIPRNTMAYLVDGNHDVRKKARNAISQAVRKFIQSAEEAGEAREKCRDAVRRFIAIMQANFMDNAIPEYRVGGLIGLASAAIALDKYLDDHAEVFIKLELPYFTDQDSTVRYYACELCCDEDGDVRQSLQLMNRLLRDIVLDSGSQAVEMAVDLIAGRMYITNAFVRILLGRAGCVGALPHGVPLALQGDLRNEGQGRQRRPLQGRAGQHAEHRIRREKGQHSVGPRDRVPSTSDYSLCGLGTKGAALRVQEGFPLLLRAIVLLIADKNGGWSGELRHDSVSDISTSAQEANKHLFRATKEQRTISNVERVTIELTGILDTSVSHVVMLTALQWLALLLELKPRVMQDTVPAVTKAVVSCFRHGDSELVTEATLKAIVLVLELGTEHFTLVSQQLLDLFRGDDSLLEERGYRIIINVCKQIGFEKFYKITSECLALETDGHFLQRIVYTLNWTLMTSDDAKEMRKRLLTAEGDALGTQLQKCWLV